MTQINRQAPIITSEFSFLSLLPLSHMFEQMGGFFTPLYRGAGIVYLRTLKPSAIIEALREEDIYVIMSVPRLMHLNCIASGCDSVSWSRSWEFR